MKIPDYLPTPTGGINTKDGWSRKEKLNLIALVINIIILAALVFAMFRFFKRQDDLTVDYKKLQQLEAERAYHQKVIHQQESVIAEKDNVISNQLARDSALVQVIDGYAAAIKKLNNEQVKISTTIQSYGSPELKRAYANFR